mgnify:CR=1
MLSTTAIAHRALLMLMIISLSACGQTGSLYLPTTAEPVNTPFSSPANTKN